MGGGNIFRMIGAVVGSQVRIVAVYGYIIVPLKNVLEFHFAYGRGVLDHRI